MSYSFKKGSFAATNLDAAPGDVFAWKCEQPINKRKFHLCISYDYDFVFLNTPKDRYFPSDFAIAAEHLRFLKPTRAQFSSVSCVDIQVVGTHAMFRARKPEHLGSLSTNVLGHLLRHICSLRTTAPEDAERLVEVNNTMRHNLLNPSEITGRPRMRR